MVTYFW